MPAVIVGAPAPIFVDKSQGTPGAPSPTGGVLTVQGQTGIYPVSTIAGVTGPVGVTGPAHRFITSPNALSAGLYAFVTPYGTLRTSNEPSTMFGEDFSANIDTTNKWTLYTQNGATFTVSNGLASLKPGLTANAGVSLTTKATFTTDGLGFRVLGLVYRHEAVAVAGAHHFWGFGTKSGTWTATAPLTDAIGFEQDTSGALNACIWTSGTKTFSQALTRASDGQLHRYAVMLRADLVLWYQDNIEVPVASANFPQPGTMTLPVRVHCINPSSGPSNAPTSVVMAVGVADSARSNVAISDSRYPWRTATVNSLGQLVTTTTPTDSTPGFSKGFIVWSSTTPTPIYQTTYTEQTSNAQRSLVSTSANDTAAGTGARTVLITYYTSALGGPYTETVTLNGTTPVNTVASDICFIEKMVVTTVGSGGVNAGTISLKASTGGGGATIWSIATGANQTFGAHHYVPAGKSCYLTSCAAGVKGADATGAYIRARDPTNATSAYNQVSDLIRVPSNGQTSRSYNTPIRITGPAVMVMWVAPDSSSTRTYYGAFEYYDQ